ncbi:MAG: hypothetical protein E7675_05395 [Ruminococcaceae bacterium]|nr:hypothetical protein [Oscillospiraceae bacterium]
MKHADNEIIFIKNEDVTFYYDRSRCFDWFDKKVYNLSKLGSERRSGYYTEYVDHPTVKGSMAIGVERDEAYDMIGPGNLTVFYHNGEKYSFECYTDTVFSGQYGISISADGEHIYVISYIKGLWCYNKHGEILWKTRYTSAGHVYIHNDGTVTCVTGTHLILLDENGKAIKKRKLFDGVRCEMSHKNIGILTSENILAVVDVKTLEPILKISLLKLNIYNFHEILEADEYYIVRGYELVGIDELPNGKRKLNEKDLIYLLDRNGNVIRKIDDGKWTFSSRAYFDRTSNEIVLYALYKHHTSKTYRIPVKPDQIEEVIYEKTFYSDSKK